MVGRLEEFEDVEIGCLGFGLGLLRGALKRNGNRRRRLGSANRLNRNARS